MSASQPQSAPRNGGELPGGVLVSLINFGQIIVVVVALGAVIAAGMRFGRAAAEREPRELPEVMVDVDWQSPDSSEFCLACHRPVGPAMAGLDVEHGHPQNVALSEEQAAAIADLGTIAGPDGALICTSCHTLSADPDQPYMLADIRADGKLCAHCHPGHYARGTAHDLRESAPEEINRLGQTAVEGGPCSACHLAHRYARDFVPAPEDPDGRCTTCHNLYGSGRRHARTAMDHPEARCLECHDPHETRFGEFLNAPVEALCVRCHEQFDAGPIAGMHPLGRMESRVPQQLLDAGAVAPVDSHQLTCIVCHKTHTAEHESMLLLSAATNELCLACHADELSERGGGHRSMHGQLPILSDAQRQVVEHWDAPLGENGELLCVSCHRVHAGRPDAKLLAFTQRYGEVCIDCHAQQAGIVGSLHDLRVARDRDNIHVTAAREQGVCAACHAAHGPTLRTCGVDPAQTDACTNCHAAGQCAERLPIEPPLHPQTHCADCHDPHMFDHGDFLREESGALCLDCHADFGRIAGGPHDFTNQPIEAGAERPSLCLHCHRTHGGANERFLRHPGDDKLETHPDALCLACHEDANWGMHSPIAALHPQRIPDTGRELTCQTCHDPHGGANPSQLARIAPGEPTEKVCLACHEQQRHMNLTGHSPEHLHNAGFVTDSCKPCHAMHAEPDDSWGEMLSPRFLVESGAHPDTRTALLPCVACHRPDGPAPMHTAETHPRREMFNIFPSDAPGYLPLFDEHGRIQPDGQVACRTCHLSHGREDLLSHLAERGEVPESELNSMRMQLRPFVGPNICTECHGPEARPLFLFFHDPARRATLRDPAHRAQPPHPSRGGPRR